LNAHVITFPVMDDRMDPTKRISASPIGFFHDKLFLDS
jgi:hypothetical protein